MPILLVVVTVLGSLAALLMAMPRVYFAMARGDLFFPAAAALHSRYHILARAIAIQASWPASWLCSVPSYDNRRLDRGIP
jgi:basic amino acid/polyamine antiporter, APA family